MKSTENAADLAHDPDVERVRRVVAIEQAARSGQLDQHTLGHLVSAVTEAVSVAQERHASTPTGDTPSDLRGAALEAAWDAAWQAAWVLMMKPASDDVE